LIEAFFQGEQTVRAHRQEDAGRHLGSAVPAVVLGRSPARLIPALHRAGFGRKNPLAGSAYRHGLGDLMPNYKVTKIEAVGPSYAEKLEAVHIATTADLLKACAHSKNRKTLA
jgi:hypothetical protein